MARLTLFTILTVVSATHLITPKAVTIPQLTSQGALGIGKPILHKHGLIQVELPVRHQAVSPAAITAAAPYAVGAPTKGIVVDQTAPTYFCKKEGYVLEGLDTCVMTDLVEARFVCPGGFDFFDGECTRRATFLQICPAGFETRDGTCAKVVTAASISVCPDGSYEVSPGVCEREIVQTLATHCHEGKFDGANCIVEGHIEARAFCPEGFSFFDGACVQEETYDCTNNLQTAGFAAAPVGATQFGTIGVTQGVTQGLGLGLGHLGGGHLGGGHLGHGHLGGGHGHLRQLTALAQPIGYSAGLIGAKPALAGLGHPCKAKKLGLGLGSYAAVGGAYSAGAEVTECAAAAAVAAPVTVAAPLAVAAPIAVAAPLAVPAPVALTPVTIPAPVAVAAVEEVKTLVQPTKTTVTIQKTCTRVTSTALVFACDEGILQGQQCLVRTPIAPSLICKHRGDAHHCFSTQRVAALSVCPANYTRECSNGRCECAALEAAAFVQSCPAGFEEGGAEGCLRIASASIVCPTGYTLQGESCVRILREPADCVFSVTYECDRTRGPCQ